MSEAVFHYYLDASALVKLIVDETGANDLRAYVNETLNAYATTISYFEGLNVLKRKWDAKWNDPAYHKAVEKLFQMMNGGKPETDNLSVTDKANFMDVIQLSQQHNIDFADAFQLLAILNGTYSPFCLGSETRFLSADKDLVRAARSYKIKTWRCSKDGPPKWIDKVEKRGREIS
jgi:predicted nucleic acid-binding protein